MKTLLVSEALGYIWHGLVITPHIILWDVITYSCHRYLHLMGCMGKELGLYPTIFLHVEINPIMCNKTKNSKTAYTVHGVYYRKIHFLIFHIFLDPCGAVTCQHGGTCAAGICNCVAGYSGYRCEKSEYMYHGPVSQFPQFTCPISHNTFRTEMCTLCQSALRIGFTMGLLPDTANCACAMNAGNVFLATDFKGNR